MKPINIYILFFLFFLSCNKPNEATLKDDINNISENYSEGFFIVNSGNYDWGVGTLSHYDTNKKISSHKIFQKKNNFEMGNVFQSASIFEDNIFMVMNNSEKIIISNYHNMNFITEINIKGSSPRYIQKITDTKYYITELYSGGYWILNIPKEGKITYKKKELSYEGTEKMILYDDYIYMTANKTTYSTEESKIFKIDPVSDNVIGEVEVYVNPNSMVLDKNSKIWVLSGGKLGSNTFAITKINPKTMKIEFKKEIKRNEGITTWPSHLVISKDILYFQNSNVYRFFIDSETLEERAFISIPNRHQIYGLNISKEDEIYISDAIDFNQEGYIRIYDKDGNHKKDIKAGIIPKDIVFIK